MKYKRLIHDKTLIIIMRKLFTIWMSKFKYQNEQGKIRGAPRKMSESINY